MESFKAAVSSTYLLINCKYFLPLLSLATSELDEDGQYLVEVEDELFREMPGNG